MEIEIRENERGLQMGQGILSKEYDVVLVENNRN
jgi:hypothetical protein